MELVAATVVASLAYVYAPLLRLHAARQLRVSLPAGAVAPGAASVSATELVELDADVTAFCNAESEEFARNDLKQLARSLYAEHGDWNVVLAELGKVA